MTPLVTDQSCLSMWSNSRARRAHAWLGVFLLLCAVLTGSPTTAQAPTKNVLVLFSSASQNTDRKQIEAALRAHYSGQMNVYTAFVFSNSEQLAEGDSYLDSVAETIRHSYMKVRLDVIVVAAPGALEFAIRYRNRIFPGVPIVFYGLSKDELAGIALQPGMVGRTESSDIQSTINLALRLHPDTGTVAIIDLAKGLWWSAAHSELVQRHGRVKEIDIIGAASPEEIRQDRRSAGSHSRSFPVAARRRRGKAHRRL